METKMKRKLLLCAFLFLLALPGHAQLMPHDSVATAFSPDSARFVADSLIRYAERYTGTPYRLGAVGPREFDCSSFVRHVYAGIGIEVPRYTWTQIKAGKEIKRVMDLQRGDLVFFGKRRGVRDIGHIGIVVSVDLPHSDFTFIHCGTSAGVTTVHYSSPYFLMRYMTARRILPDFPETD